MDRRLDSVLRRFARLAPPADAREGLPRPPEADRDRRDNEHFRHLLAFVLAPDSNCIDVGSHSGAILSEILRCAPYGRHIAYEPLPHFHAELSSRFPQVDVRRAALSSKTGERTFTYVPDLPGYSGFKKRKYPSDADVETITVRVENLDSALPAGYVPTLIKIDVEGAERQVIEGALRTITIHRPIVAFEHGKGAADHYGTTPAQIFELLCGEAGLRIFDIDGNGPLTLDAFNETFERGEVWNFVAHV